MTRVGGPHRVPRGGLIDRNRPIEFEYDGSRLAGLEGDSVASALLANGIRIVGRSFKYHRPRGLFSAGVEEPNGLLTAGRGAFETPSVRAPLQRLEPGLVLRTQSGWPNVGFDIGRILDFTASLWKAGFYNKTFIWPSWHFYEPLIRRMAGLGRAPEEADPDRYEARNAHCDVLVVGGGCAGLKAAAEAARTGARVMLAERDTVLGGVAALGVARAEAVDRRLGTHQRNGVARRRKPHFQPPESTNSLPTCSACRM